MGDVYLYPDHLDYDEDEELARQAVYDAWVDKEIDYLLEEQNK